MFRLIQNIAADAYRSAGERGKDTSCCGCLSAALGEKNEYWAAVDEARETKEEDVTTAEQKDTLEAAVDYYDAKLHNTTYDELADLIITAATWVQSAKESEDLENNGGHWAPERNGDVMLASGIIAFVIDRIQGITAAATMLNAQLLRRVITLKMIYNTYRKD